MKKLILLTGILFAVVNITEAQSNVDALRYSQTNVEGTARSMGMGGAFGALGADFSSLSINPAGLGVYRGSELTFSPEIYIAGTKARYYGRESNESKFNLNLSNFGYVATFKKDNSLLKYVNFGVGFNRIANLNRLTTVTGDNPYTTYSDYMAADANQFGLDDYFSRFSSSLFYDAYLIDYDTLSGNYVIGGDYLYKDGTFRPTEQHFSTNEWGRINEWTFSIGFNFDDKVYFGGTFGIQPLYYEFDKNTKEYDATDRSYEYFNYYENLKVNGTGYTAKIGVIVKPVQALRLGLAFHLPVTYRIDEKYSTNITSRYINWDTYDPIDLNGNTLDRLENNYKIITPFKAIGSAGLVLGKFLVLSTDVEYVDYSSMRITSSQDDYSDQNELIKQVYRDNINFKLGSELRLGNIYFRLGGDYFGSPYASSEDNANSNRYGASLGLGMRDKKFFFDMAYQYVFSTNGEKTFMYGAYDGDGNWRDNPADLTKRTSRIVTTFGFRF